MTVGQAIAGERKIPQQARSRALVEAILDATARVLVDHGFAGTTTNRVAERAGVSVGSLYQYFPSREALVAAVARRHSARLKAALEEELSEEHATLEKAISAMLRAVVGAHRVSPELTAVLAGEVPKLGALDWKAESTLRGVALTRAVLDRHAHELRPDIDNEKAAFICSTCVEGVINAAARHTPSRVADGSICDELTSFLTKYLIG